MPALVRLREWPGVLGVSLRSGSLRLYAPEAERLLAEWQARWPFTELGAGWLPLGRARHGRCLYRLLAGI